VAKEARNAISMGNNRVRSNGRSRKNKCSSKKQEQGIELLRRDPYTMDINRGRNCYACGGFRHIA